MALMNKPDEKIFASKAKEREVEVFPDHSRGWGVSFEQTEGIPPMEWFNALFKRLDENILYVLQRGLPEWSATITYPKGAYVQYEGLSYKSLKETTNKQPNEANSEHWARWGLMASDLVKATLTQFGITQLFTGYDSDREDLALTPKTAKMLKAFIDSNTRSLDNYIPNSKKSNAVDSPSADTVATSSAVKAANDNANGRVSRNGDNLNGAMRSKHFGAGGYAAQYTGDAPFLVTEVNTVNRDTFHPFVKGRVRSKGNYGAAFSFGYTTYQPNNPCNVGEFGRGAICLTADSGDSRVWTFEHNGDFIASKDIVDGGGVVLSVLNSLFHNFRNKFTTDHYSGSQSVSQVYRIPLSANKGIKIYASYLTIAAGIGTHRFRLAESLGGFRLGFAVDAGAGMLRHGIVMESDTAVVVHSEVFNSPHGVNVLLIGEYNY